MFYMNNPCKVIREIDGKFSEIVVYPHFADSVEGSQWCVACMIGSMDGANPSHTCEEYQDVIDHINDTQTEMLVMAENRLLQKEPIEFAKWREAISHIKDLNKKAIQSRRDQKRVSDKRHSLKNKIISLKAQIEFNETLIKSQENELSTLEDSIDQSRKSLSTTKGLVSVGGLTLSMSGDDLRDIIGSALTYRRLEMGKVHNWEWYDESLRGFDLDGEVDELISSLKIEKLS